MLTYCIANQGEPIEVEAAAYAAGFRYAASAQTPPRGVIRSVAMQRIGSDGVARSVMTSILPYPGGGGALPRPGGHLHRHGPEDGLRRFRDLAGLARRPPPDPSTGGSVLGAMTVQVTTRAGSAPPPPG